MIRAYAVISHNRPILHKVNIFILVFTMLYCGYEVLANERIAFFIGFILMAFPMFIMLKSSEYKRKYFQ